MCYSSGLFPYPLIALLYQGGDHTITLPLLRGVAGVYGPVRYVV